MKDYNMPFKNAAIDKMSTKFGKGPGLPNPFLRPNPLEQAIKGKPVRSALEEAVMTRPSSSVKTSKVDIPKTQIPSKPVTTSEKADVKHPIVAQVKKNILSNLENKGNMTPDERLDLRKHKIKNALEIGGDLLLMSTMLRNR